MSVTQQPVRAEELKCSDLMIGNWIEQQSIDKIKWYPVQVEVLYDRNGWDYINPHTYNGIEDSMDVFRGIPLTPEILEKCGFVQNTHTYTWTLDKIDLDQYASLVGIYYQGRRIEFVHTLQNICSVVYGVDLNITL